MTTLSLLFTLFTFLKSIFRTKNDMCSFEFFSLQKGFKMGEQKSSSRRNSWRSCNLSWKILFKNRKKTFLRKSAIWRIESFLFFQNPIIYQIIPSMRRFARQSIRQHMMAVFEPKWNFEKILSFMKWEVCAKVFFGYY